MWRLTNTLSLTYLESFHSQIMVAPLFLFQTTKTFDSHFIFFVSLTSWLMKEEIPWALASKYDKFKIWPSLWPHSHFTIWFWENFIFLTTINSLLFFLFYSSLFYCPFQDQIYTDYYFLFLSSLSLSTLKHYSIYMLSYIEEK